MGQQREDLLGETVISCPSADKAPCLHGGMMIPLVTMVIASPWSPDLILTAWRYWGRESAIVRGIRVSLLYHNSLKVEVSVWYGLFLTHDAFF